MSIHNHPLLATKSEAFLRVAFHCLVLNVLNHSRSLVPAVLPRGNTMSECHRPWGEGNLRPPDTPSQPRPPSWRKRPTAEDYFDKDNRKTHDCRSGAPSANGNPDHSTSSDPSANNYPGQCSPAATDVNTSRSTAIHKTSLTDGSHHLSSLAASRTSATRRRKLMNLETSIPIGFVQIFKAH